MNATASGAGGIPGTASSIAYPAGNPDVLEELAARLQAQAGEVGDLAAATHKAAAGIISDAGWQGQAATDAAAFHAALVRGLGRAESPLRGLAAAARTLAASLRTAQNRVAAYNAAAERANASGNDPGYVSAAQGAAADAELALAAHAETGNQVAAQVNELAGELGSVFAPEGTLRGVIDRVHAALGRPGPMAGCI